MNGKQKWVVVIMDLLLLTELCTSIYVSRHSDGDVTFVFLSTFVPALLLTVALSRMAIRRLRTPEPPESGGDPVPSIAVEQN